jgi:hypothetical protein
MTANPIEKARTVAEKAAQELATLEAAEAERAAQKAAERDVQQRDLDVKFLAVWETLDRELLEGSGKTAAEAIYEGGDPIQAVAAFWIARAKRNAVRDHARNAYRRLHGEWPHTGFALELSVRDMMIGDRLEEAISRAAGMHASDLEDTLRAEYEVGE